MLVDKLSRKTKMTAFDSIYNDSTHSYKRFLIMCISQTMVQKANFTSRLWVCVSGQTLQKDESHAIRQYLQRLDIFLQKIKDVTKVQYSVSAVGLC